MEPYNKREIERILKSNLLIHWWNMGSKTLQYNGNVKDYLKELNVKYTIKATKTEYCEVLTIKVKFSIGSLKDVSFTSGSFEDIVRMVVNVQLTYLGDKSRYTLLGRTRNFTY
jgi:hypothetical protein